MPATEAPARRRLGLLLEIAVALALVAIVPLAIASWSLVSVNREALVEQLLRTHSVSARTAADAIDAFLGSRRTLAGTLLLDPEIGRDPTSTAAQARLRDALASWSEAGIVAAALTEDDGTLLVQARQKGVGELADQLLSGRPGAPARLRRIELHPWVRLEVPVPGRTATLRLAVDAQPLLRTLAPDELGEQARLLLADRGGEPLLGSAEELANLPAPLRDTALSARLSGSGRYRDAAGRIVVGAWSSADDGRWIVLSTQPADVAEAAARRMAERSALAVLLALGLAVAISIVAWRSLVRPVRALLGAQRQLAGLQSAPARGSETAELRSAMTALERNARDRMALDQVFLGRYQVIEILGSGGMGTVFRGWDPHLQRTVALKTIRLEGKAKRTQDSNAAVGRLLAEAVVAAQIAHPNVVAIYDAEQVGDVGYVAMEYVHGTGLDRYFEGRGKLPWREVVPLGREIASGLAAAHHRGLVHRDIKPGNVLLGHDGTIKVADFGLAQFLSLQREKSGIVVGTPGFISPEALLGAPFTAAADLFALGVILHRALLGSYPFQGRTLREVIAATVHSELITPERFEPALVPRPLAEIVCGLLESDPARRLAPAEVVAARLEALARQYGLVWTLDFARPERAIASAEVFRSLELPVSAAESAAGSRA